MENTKLKRKRECPVQFRDFVIVGDEIWYSASGFNGLFRADMKTHKSMFVGRFPNEVVEYSVNLYGGVCRYENYLVFAPLRANNIAFYDMENAEFETYAIPDFEKKTEYPFIEKFEGIVMDGSDIFFLGHTYPVIMQMNMVTKEIQMHMAWHKRFEEFGKHPGTYMFDRHVVLRDERFWVSSRQNHVLMSFDMKEKQADFVAVGEQDAQYSTLAYGAGSYWLIDTLQNVLLRYTEETKELQHVVKLLGGVGNFDIVSCNDRIWIFAKSFRKDITTYDMVYDIKSDTLETLDLKSSHGNNGVIFAKEIGGYVYCMYPDQNYFYKLSYKDGGLVIDKIELDYDDEVYDYAYASKKRGGVFLEKKEEEQYNTHKIILSRLDTFLAYHEVTCTFPNEGQSVGSVIWNELKGGI